MQVPVVDQAPPSLLLLDLVDLQSQAAARSQPGSEQTGRVAMQLLPDEAAPERLFVRTQPAAWAITLSWLPALANFLAEGMSFYHSILSSSAIGWPDGSLVECHTCCCCIPANVVLQSSQYTVKRLQGKTVRGG